MFNEPVADASLVACPDCDLVQRLPAVPPGASVRCPRCDLELWRRRDDPLQRTLALALAAAILYVVANVTPMLGLQAVGHKASTTVFGGAVQLWNDGRGTVAALVLSTAVVAPALHEVHDGTEEVRAHIESALSDPDPKRRMVATACYLIDALGLRVGDEKDPDEADTVGATTLRPFRRPPAGPARRSGRSDRSGHLHAGHAFSLHGVSRAAENRRAAGGRSSATSRSTTGCRSSAARSTST